MKNTFQLFCVAPLFLSLAAARSDDVLGRAECYGAFALSGFDILDFDSYPNFFNDESVFQLAQTGAYYGAAGIEEYVRFADPQSPYVEELKAYDKNAQVKTASDPVTGECVMTVVDTTAIRYSDVVDIDRATIRSALLKIYFEPTSMSTVAISKIYLYYQEPYLDYFFGTLLNTPQTREFVCRAMTDSCDETWAFSVDSCVARLESLPAIGENVDVSGNSQGCRALHAVFAATNPVHCPHISFVPQPDVNGKIKCQTSSYREVSDMFDDDDMLVFDQRRQQLGLDNEMAAVLCDCSARSDWGADSSLWDQFLYLLNEVGSLGPLPQSWWFGVLPYCEICDQDRNNIFDVVPLGRLWE